MASRFRLVVTGANGALGRATISRAIERYDRGLEIVAAVRSARAAAELPPIPPERGRIERISYDDRESLAKALEGAVALAHLPGVLVERAGATYESAHVAATESAVGAARECGVGKIVLASAVGADPESRNRYFATKGRSEEIVRASGIPFTILRAPLLLGPGTEGARALSRETAPGRRWLLAGGETWHQPMDVDDLAEGVLRAALTPELASGQTLEVGGPARLRYRELVERAARLRGTRVRILRAPIWPVRWAVALRARLGAPGLSPDALEVLLTDTDVDAVAAAKALGISLSTLETTLRRSLLLPEGE